MHGGAQGHAGGVQAKLRQDLRPTLVANWKVWVPFQLVNFRFVPPSLQARPSQGTGRCLGGAAARALPGLLHRPASDRPGMSRLRVRFCCGCGRCGAQHSDHAGSCLLGARTVAWPQLTSMVFCT